MRTCLAFVCITALGCGSAPVPITYLTESAGKKIWANSLDEAVKPMWIQSDSIRSEIQPGERWFKITVDSAETYSIVVDAGISDACDPSVDGTRRDCQRFEIAGRRATSGLTGDEFEFSAFGYEGSLHGVAANYSPAKTALIFTNNSSPQQFYFRIQNGSAVSMPASIHILKFAQKFFVHPLVSQPQSARGIAYFNLFGHRTRLRKGLTRNGHDGVDLAMTSTDTSSSPFAVVQEVVSVADGTVIKVQLESCAIGRVVWIMHDTPWGPMTSMYAHLSSSFVQAGQKLRKGQRIGFVAEEPLCDGGYYGHLHFEMWDRLESVWHDGYSSGNGQIDPIPYIFYR